MNPIYQVKIHGRTLESRNLRQLLARAVSEKRNMDQRIRICSQRDQGSVHAEQCRREETGLAYNF
jgi:hypothetical protein